MFTKKDFLLLQDAINEGVKKFWLNGVSKEDFPFTTSSRLERNLRRALADAFAEKLKYTSDGFDATTFKRSILEHDLETKDKPLTEAEIEKAALRGSLGLG